MKTKATPSVEMMLRNLGSAIAALDQLDPGAIAEDGRLKFIADQLPGHANRIARWSKRYAVIWFDVGNVVQEIENHWQWPSGVNLIEIADRACAVTTKRNIYIGYHDALEAICKFVEAYAMGGIELVDK